MNPRIEMLVTAVVLLGSAGNVPAQSTEELNLGFERPGDTPLLPKAWTVSGDGFRTNASGYQVELDRGEAKSGQRSLRMKSTGQGSFGNAYLTLPGKVAAGQHIKISGWIKTKDVAAGGYAGLWCRLDGPAGMLAHDNMVVRIDAEGEVTSNDRGVRGTTDWKLYSVEHDVPPSATAVVFGSILTGEGTAWWDDFAVEIDGQPYQGKSLAEPAAEREPKPAKVRGAGGSLDGIWEGFLRPEPGTELRIVLKVDPPEQEGGPPRAAFYSPDQGKAEDSFPADPIALDGKAVSFTVKALRGSFSGTMNEAGDEIQGDWKQGPANLPITFKRDEAALVFPEIWEGKLKAGPTQLRLIFHITRLKGGGLRATFDSPDQESHCTKIDEVSIDKGTLTMVARSIRAAFAGKLNDEGTESVGEWKQGGLAIPFTIKKVAAPTRPQRPQRPRRPFPYDETLVTYKNEAAGVTLAGTLTTPKGKGPFPAVVLITGSGALDRDETMYGHKPFLLLADQLTRRGIAVLRVDDRGVGGSTGDTDTATTEDFAGDVLAGVAFLKMRPEVDPAQLGLLGHSEGGIIAPMVAVRSQDVAFLVLLAGTGVDGEELCLRQNHLMVKAAGGSEELLKFLGELLPKQIAAIKAEKDPKIASEKLRAIAKEELARLPEAERTALERRRLVAQQPGGSVEPSLDPLFPDLRPAADAPEGQVPRPGDQWREGSAGPSQGEPRRDRVGPE